MHEYYFEVRIRRTGWRGLLEYVTKGVTWRRTFLSRKQIPEMEESLKVYLDEVIEKVEPVNKE